MAAIRALSALLVKAALLCSDIILKMGGLSLLHHFCVTVTVSQT